MFDLSLETKLWLASEVRIWALAAAAVLAIVSFGATWAQTRWQTESAALKEEAARIREAELQARVAEASAAAASANQGAAKANERAAGLENEAAQARAEQERLKAQLAWRTISPGQLQHLSAALSMAPGKSVTLAYTANDPEALFLAIQISRAFEQAHWKIRPESRTYGSQLIFGLRIPGPESETVRVLRDAFKTANIQFSTEDVPAADMAIVYPGESDAALVFVGAKLPPF
jgi:hypothetical protein